MHFLNQKAYWNVSQYQNTKNSSLFDSFVNKKMPN